MSSGARFLMSDLLFRCEEGLLLREGRGAVRAGGAGAGAGVRAGVLLPGVRRHDPLPAAELPDAHVRQPGDAGRTLLPRVRQRYGAVRWRSQAEFGC